MQRTQKAMLRNSAVVLVLIGVAACAAPQEAPRPSNDPNRPASPDVVPVDGVAEPASAPLEEPAEQSTQPPVQVAAPGTASEAATDGEVRNYAVEPADEPPVPQSSSTTASGGSKALGWGEEEFELFTDPAFKRHFVQSYLSETEIEPAVSEDEAEYVLEVYELMTNENVEEAMEVIEEHGGGGSSAVFDFLAGNLHFQLEEVDEAERAYRRAIDKHPKFRRAWGNIAQLHFREGNFDEALPAFARVIELGGGEAVIYGLLGVCHSKLGHDLSAESAFRMATLLDPVRLEWKMGLAESFFKQERYADAASLFGELIEGNPNRPEFWVGQGEAYARLGEAMRAAENFEVADRLGGSTTDSLNNLGDIYANEGLFDIAGEAYIRALDFAAENDVEPNIGRAIRGAKFMSGNNLTDEVLALIDGIESRIGGELNVEQQTDLLRLRARVAVEEGAGEEEALILEEIVELNPVDGDALILLGQHAYNSGEPERASLYYDRAAAIEKYEGRAKRLHGQMLVKLGRYAEALPYLKRALALNPTESIQKYVDQVERLAKTR